MILGNQHCTADDCYTFSHTAAVCNRKQPRKCGCAYCAEARRIVKGVSQL